MNTVNTIIGSVVFVLLLAVGGYMVYTGGNQPTRSLVAKDATSTQLASDEVLQRLQRVRDINLKTELFSSPSFVSLKNFGITIESQSTGRDNPFRPAVQSTPAQVTDSSPVNLTATSSQPDDQADDTATTSDATPTEDATTTPEEPTTNTGTSTSQ